MYLQQLGTRAKMAIDLPLPLNHSFAHFSLTIATFIVKSIGNESTRAVHQIQQSDKNVNLLSMFGFRDRAKKR